MNFNEYQDKAKETAVYPAQGDNYSYPVLGLVGEAGEVAEKIKKIIRDKSGIVGEEDRLEIIRELGDVLWYIAILADEMDSDLETVASTNLAKIKSRQERGKIHGSGDNR